jgi:hypothetical protein
MIALAAAIRDYWHAVERDLATMGLDADDIGTAKLDDCKFISIVLAAPPGSACHHFNPKAWSRTDELIATLGEQQAGVVTLNGRYERPEVDSTPRKPASVLDGMMPYRGVVLDALPNDEFTVKLKERQRIAREGAKTS